MPAFLAPGRGVGADKRIEVFGGVDASLEAGSLSVSCSTQEWLFNRDEQDRVYGVVELPDVNSVLTLGWYYLVATYEFRDQFG